MRILVTAGNTQTPIDMVRCLTNIFTGRTGGRIAIEAFRRGHQVTHFTSHPEVIAELAGPLPFPAEHWTLQPYRTFDDLQRLLATTIPNGGFDVIIHAAAVSDYALAGIFATEKNDVLVDVSAGKVKSHHAELWLRMVPTPKLIDSIREPWGFMGTLVKFKLEVGMGDADLLAVAEKSRTQSHADLMVANTLEGSHEWAFVGPIEGQYTRVSREELASSVLAEVERLQIAKSSSGA
ncbi:MAG: bifunctional phosphopantothenoylcysteine decarboxylase/phosphopantothenate synthase [Planctomycetes bacterium]|nr:bifunctional phosphopantothenoylcysteine decarboxylase/phosphopantothenate synthase [Planctomycetota bacterium]